MTAAPRTALPPTTLATLAPEHLPSQRAILGPISLELGGHLPELAVAYRTYGTLNQARDNAVLVAHALTGDQFVAEPHPLTGRPGWWTSMVGPGRPIDTDRYFVICANVLGGCMGTTGPRSPDPATGRPYGTQFPTITIGDMVEAHRRLLDHLGVGRLAAAIGGSMGGMQALGFAAAHPARVERAIIVASSFRHSAQNIAFHEVGRQAIMADLAWAEGAYEATGQVPARGLAVARMAAHITYLSEAALTRKFGRARREAAVGLQPFGADFQVESYLRHQGSTFVDRFDANSYLYITKAMDLFDLEAANEGHLVRAFKGSTTRFLLVSFSSDWLFPSSESRILAHALNAAGAEVGFVQIESDKGHDAFLLEEPQFHATVRGFLHGRPAGDDPESDTAPVPAPPLRADQATIADLVPPRARVLDVGCGDGSLLAHLMSARQASARGLELDGDAVAKAVARGLPVVQGDALTDLAYWPDGSFDVAILSRSLQAMAEPQRVLGHLVRVARRAIVSVENHGHWRTRRALLLQGRLPARAAAWWERTTIHPSTLHDLMQLFAALDLTVETTVLVSDQGERRQTVMPRKRDNWLAEQAVFVVRRR